MSDYVAESGQERILRGCVPVTELGCWVWMESTKNGYGQLTWRGKNTYAHRLSYSVFKGDIPPDALICHTCDNRYCVNPDHLYAGDKRSNILDHIKTGKHYNQFGPITIENCNG